MKKFNEDNLINDLYDLYHKTLSKEIHYKIASVAVNAAKAIAMNRTVSLKIKHSLTKKAKK